MATAIDSSDFVPEFSDDAGTTWQTLICPTSWTASGTSEVTKTSTLTCGVLSAPGAFGYECSADAIAAKVSRTGRNSRSRPVHERRF
jgi:hypothetical protein